MSEFGRYCIVVVRGLKMKDFKKVNNPLTIIAIFAALAEIAGTGVLLGLDDGLQKTFIWFVMVFPVLLVGLFFLTLNYNPKVLYAPSDFSDENNFLSLLAGQIQLDQKLSEVSMIVAESKEEISKEPNEFKDSILQKLELKIKTMASLLDESQTKNQELLLNSYLASSLKKLPYIQYKILARLSREPEGFDINDWKKHPNTFRSLQSLEAQGFVQIFEDRAYTHDIIKKALE